MIFQIRTSTHLWIIPCDQKLMNNWNLLVYIWIFRAIQSMRALEWVRKHLQYHYTQMVVRSHLQSSSFWFTHFCGSCSPTKNVADALEFIWAIFFLKLKFLSNIFLIPTSVLRGSSVTSFGWNPRVNLEDFVKPEKVTGGNCFPWIHYFQDEHDQRIFSLELTCPWQKSNPQGLRL